MKAKDKQQTEENVISWNKGTGTNSHV